VLLLVFEARDDPAAVAAYRWLLEIIATNILGTFYNMRLSK